MLVLFILKTCPTYAHFYNIWHIYKNFQGSRYKPYQIAKTNNRITWIITSQATAQDCRMTLLLEKTKWKGKQDSQPSIRQNAQLLDKNNPSCFWWENCHFSSRPARTTQRLYETRWSMPRNLPVVDLRKISWTFSCKSCQLATEGFSILDTKIELNVSVVPKQWKIGLQMMTLFPHTGTVRIVSSFAGQTTPTCLSVQHFKTRGHTIFLPG